MNFQKQKLLWSLPDWATCISKSMEAGRRQKLYQTVICDPNTGSQQDGHIFIISVPLPASVTSVSPCVPQDYFMTAGFSKVGGVGMYFRGEVWGRIDYGRTLVLISYILELKMGECQNPCNIILSECMDVWMRNFTHGLGIWKLGLQLVVIFGNVLEALGIGELVKNKYVLRAMLWEFIAWCYVHFVLVLHVCSWGDECFNFLLCTPVVTPPLPLQTLALES